MALLLLTRYRQLVFMGVDPDGAVAAGLPVKTLQLIQSLVTSMVIVSAMAAVGVILVIGLLCAPVLPRFVACEESAGGDVAVFVGWSWR